MHLPRKSIQARGAPFSGTPGSVIRSFGVEASFAPVPLVTLGLALLLPALLPSGVIRVWSGMDLTALCAPTLLHPFLSGFGGAVAVWFCAALGIDRCPTVRDTCCAASRGAFRDMTATEARR